MQLVLLRAVLVLTMVFAVVGASGAGPARALHPAEAHVGKLRMLTDHYRRVTWKFERAAHVKRTPTSFSYRRSASRAYLLWAVKSWTKHAYVAQRIALRALHRKLAVRLPQPPALRARLARRITYSHRLAVRLRRIYPGHVSRSFATARTRSGAAALRLWQERSASAALAVAVHAMRRAEISSGLRDAFLCIHRYEGAWDSNTGNGYYGGLQMDEHFMSLYGPRFFRRWGTADNWPVWAQLETAARAHESGLGFTPWPNTAHVCGLM